MLEENDRIRAMEERKRENPTMMKNRRSLPAWQERDRIVRAVRDNQVRESVLVGVFAFKAEGLGLPFVLLYVPPFPPKKRIESVLVNLLSFFLISSHFSHPISTPQPMD